MFSENSKISPRQLKYLLLLEGIPKLVLLLPLCLAGKTLGSGVLCVILGTVLWYVLTRFLLSWAEPGIDLLRALEEKTGKGVLFPVYAAGLLFFLVQTAVFLNLCAEMTAMYLLPEVSVPLLCLLPLAACVYLACGSPEIRGRFSEVTGPMVLALLAVFLFLAAFGMEAYRQEETLVHTMEVLSLGPLEVAACLLPLFLPVSSVHLIGEKKDFRRSVRSAGLITAIFGGVLWTVTVGVYGKNGAAALDFPAVRVMSSVEIPGGFLQRWDILFLALFLVCMAVTIGNGLWYMRKLLQRLWAEGCAVRGTDRSTGRSRYPDYLWAICILLVYLLAAGFLDALTAVCYYRAMNLQVLTPVLLLFYLIGKAHSFSHFPSRADGRREHRTDDKKTALYVSKALVLAVLLLASAFLLGGCTAREPEERLYPMALQLGAEDGKLEVTYAWDESGMPGNTDAEDEETQGGGGEKIPENDAETEKSSGTENMLTTFSGTSMEEIRKKVSRFTEQYMDYSHVKAVILEEELQEIPLLEEEVIQWLVSEPAFASGLIVYPAKESGLTLEKANERSGGRIGVYLEGLYKNNEEYRRTATTLGNVIAEYYRQKTGNR